jgi:hypothetical protein
LLSRSPFRFGADSLRSEAAVSVLFADEPKTRIHSNEVNVQTLISSTIFAQAIASKVFKVYSPALSVRRIGCKVMLRAGWSLADSSDVLSDLSRQMVYMMRIPRIVPNYGTAFGNSRHFTAKQKTKSQQ